MSSQLTQQKRGLANWRQVGIIELSSTSARGREEKRDIAN